MGIKELLEAWKRIFAIAEKPEPDEYKLLFKITIGGILLAGAVGFLIHLALSLIQGGVGG
ncbi:MAG: protein translocase SEC61 complex subunit gamma [Desulfurococcales archaeon]|nr:protein translocase SEC61 complex subunit gamma [Desulfurococcales archaeon]